MKQSCNHTNRWLRYMMFNFLFFHIFEVTQSRYSFACGLNGRCAFMSMWILYAYMCLCSSSFHNCMNFSFTALYKHHLSISPKDRFWWSLSWMAQFLYAHTMLDYSELGFIVSTESSLSLSLAAASQRVFSPWSQCLIFGFVFVMNRSYWEVGIRFECGLQSTLSAPFRPYSFPSC